MRKILIVEDDEEFRTGLAIGLQREGYAIAAVGDGNQVLDAVLQESPDLVLLDVMLPERGGFEVCRELRQRGCELPVIMMSCQKKEEIDRVIGLELGADDYLVKPFGQRELLARIGACLRRYPIRGEALTGYSFDDVQIDFVSRTVRRAGEVVRMTAKEYAVLVFLIQRKGKVVSREELLSHIWGIDVDLTTRTVDTHILTLRKKIEKHPEQPKHLLSERSVGYRFV